MLDEEGWSEDGSTEEDDRGRGAWTVSLSTTSTSFAGPCSRFCSCSTPSTLGLCHRKSWSVGEGGKDTDAVGILGRPSGRRERSLLQPSTSWKGGADD